MYTSLPEELASSDRRKNVMVMGDIVEDVKMVREQAHHTVLKVGFMNEGASDEVTREYMNTFDIVIKGDGSLCEVNSMIKDTF